MEREKKKEREKDSLMMILMSDSILESVIIKIEISDWNLRLKSKRAKSVESFKVTTFSFVLFLSFFFYLSLLSSWNLRVAIDTFCRYFLLERERGKRKRGRNERERGSKKRICIFSSLSPSINHSLATLSVFSIDSISLSNQLSSLPTTICVYSTSVTIESVSVNYHTRSCNVWLDYTLTL